MPIPLINIIVGCFPPGVGPISLLVHRPRIQYTCDFILCLLVKYYFGMGERGEKADAALFSLKHTILRSLNIQYLNETAKPELDSIHNEITSLQAFLQRLDSSSKRVNGLDRIITDASSTLRDILKSYVPKRSDLQKSERFEYKRNPLKKLKPEIHSFSDTIKKIKEDYILQVSRPISNPLPAVTRDAASSSSRIDSGDDQKMVGMDDQLMKLKARVTGLSSKLETVSIIGMAGMGKTLLAKKVYGDPIVKNFPLRAWVTIGPNYNMRETLVRIILDMNPNFSQTCVESEEELAAHLHKILKGRRYLIVLDDIWNFQVWDEMKKHVPNDKKGGRIILTTRLQDVAIHASTETTNIHRIRFLNSEESWDLLRGKVFPEGALCPPELRKAGKKIAENCEGLALAIITISNLCKADKTPEYWKKIAEDENSLVVSAEDDSPLSKVLYKSYEHLPPNLQKYFLYMGVFPRKTNIPTSKLTKLWVAEGFVEASQLESLEAIAEGYLEDLVSRSLVLVRQWSSSGKIKTCWVHHVFRQLCVYEAEKDKFFRVINSYPDASFDDKDKISQRRLCIHKNVLFGIKGVSRSFASLSNVCSILCTGAYHQYPVRLSLGFKSLRVLDALSIRFFVFPMEIVKLNQLRFLGFSLNAGELPASISRLWNLQVLIVRPSLKMSSGAPSFLPPEIWKMRGLRHLQFIGSDLPVPCGVRDRLPNLLTLSHVSARSCTRKVLAKIPNLKKLGILIELAEDDAAEPSLLMHDVAVLSGLETFKCTVTNPNPRSRAAASLPNSFLTLPSSLKKLTLRGCGFLWEDMKAITRLPNLEVLKLQCYSFRGPKWELRELRFAQLGLLLLEDLDVEQWRADKKSFPKLHSLIIRHCYKLQQFPLKWQMLQMIELVDCSPSTVASAKQIKHDGKVGIQTRVHSSLDITTIKS
ncbi:hypothetical protein BUALT_Bualt07G0066200 [Buddleja alternifolia]|uniref:Uncharacterized protein n=1 Tax=Buddleja alternifolia TaxID=168488 RepID=A0AAV6XJG6_9LAMI|nr:hypothetical protein BUALT_Bualt07G0066200 [Buddleja alternifolia]